MMFFFNRWYINIKKIIEEEIDKNDIKNKKEKKFYKNLLLERKKKSIFKNLLNLNNNSITNDIKENIKYNNDYLKNKSSYKTKNIKIDSIRNFNSNDENKSSEFYFKSNYSFNPPIKKKFNSYFDDNETEKNKLINVKEENNNNSCNTKIKELNFFKNYFSKFPNNILEKNKKNENANPPKKN